MEERSSDVKYCEPCFGSQKNELATKYCPKCEEYLCDSCIDVHGTQKATKTHTLVPVEEANKDKKNESMTSTSANTEPCEPCTEGGKSSVANKYCRECEEKLCEECALAHTRQKITKSHELVKIEDRHASEKTCDPCIERNISNDAAKYCKVCEEYLCDNCTRVHQTQKATKAHTILNVEDVVFENIRMCEPCTDSGKNAPALFVCLECKECICGSCCKQHKSRKATKEHQTISIDKLPVPKQNTCDSCADQNESKPATKYCKDCDEEYCDQCVIVHKSFKATKGHVIIETTDPFEQFMKQMRLCEPCSETNKCCIAVKFCHECRQSLCDNCCAFHSRKRATKQHRLAEFAEDDFSETNKCGPCNFSKKLAYANWFCQECDDYLCDNCCKHHKTQKQTRNHTIKSAEELSKSGIEDMAVCEVCKMQEKAVVATCYCLDCEDPELLCDSCSQQHKSQKLSRAHRISEDIAAFHERKMSEEENTVGEIAVSQSMVEVAALPTTTTDVPGKPSASDIKADSLMLHWDKPARFGEGETYQIRFKDLDITGSKWVFHPTQPSCASVTLSDMKANTKFIFQVRVVHEDGEGPYSPQSDPVTTLTSPAARVVDFSKKTKTGKPSPSLYALPVTENRNARNIKAKTKKFSVGSPPYNEAGERIIMLVGATGTGKSTLVDGIVNYVLGVNWNDPFRFTVIDLVLEEKDRVQNQALSQTEWITCYTLNPEQGSRLGYKLTIIDTPGFGDTRGLQRDHQIVDQIRELFSEKGQKGVVYLDAVCFLIKAPDARLTATQNYIFHSIMSLFGHDIESNICTLVTFADGMEPPVLAALKQSTLPFGKHFTFNNSGLFTKNVELDSASLSPMFWDMGCKSFRAFFEHLDSMKTKSLQLTKEVLDERLKLEVTVQSLQPQIAAGLSKLDELKAERRLIEQHKTDIEANKNFKYEVTETKQIKTELQAGKYITNCIHCNISCHYPCGIPNDADKRRCSAMRDGNCTVCSSKCRWDQHANTPYIFKYESVTVQKTYQEKLEKYKKAGEKMLTHQQVIERMAEELYELEDDIGTLVTTVKKCNEKLKDIALRPNPLSMVDHIDVMIEAENHEKKDGYKGRIAVLNEFRRKAEIGKDIERFNEEAHKTIKEVHAVAGTTRKKKSFWSNLFS